MALSINLFFVGFLFCGTVQNDLDPSMDPMFLGKGQWTTSSRLLKLGEEIELHFYLPESMQAEELTIFPNYLERAEPGDAFVPGGDLRWLDGLPSEVHRLEFVNGKSYLAYQPQSAGNYIARWQAGDETFYRYFSVIRDDGIVLRFGATEDDLEGNEPTLHATGIPVDYRLKIEQFDPEDSQYQKLLAFHRYYGDMVTPSFDDTPDLTVQQRVKVYGEGLERARRLLPDVNDARSARIMMRDPKYTENDPESEFEPGYAETLMKLGVVDHCGMACNNERPWLGMPSFPYFSSPIDARKPNQEPGGTLVGHQWDFVGGWHFLGPQSLNYMASEGQWDKAAKYMRQGLEEFKNLTEMSGHPAFIYPLYDGYGFQSYGKGVRIPDLKHEYAPQKFLDQFQRHMAFVFTKEYPIVFARSLDIADYYRRHFRTTPRTVFVSKTDDIFFDMWWHPYWWTDRVFITSQRIPAHTRMSKLFAFRKARPSLYKDPLACEYIIVEDQKRSIRFERECPNPIWWYDYAIQERGSKGSRLSYTETPDVEVFREDRWHGDTLTIELRLVTDTEFDDYAIALWEIPTAYVSDRSRVETNAKDAVLAKNKDGEFHMVLFFDLRPRTELRIAIRGVSQTEERTGEE